MKTKTLSLSAHLSGEGKISDFDTSVAVDTFDGRLHVEWDPEASVTPLGQLPFFIEFLKIGDLFDPFVTDCPLAFRSPNAPSKRDILGTMLLSILAGQNRYAHITAIRADRVNPHLLGMGKVCSEDSVRRAFEKVDVEKSKTWLQTHLKRCYLPLLYEPWVMDVDSSVKTLYGRLQEGAEKGYNPQKPGRPSRVFHSYFIANLRLALDVELDAGNRTASKYARPGLFNFIDSLSPDTRPYLIRGDIGFGNEDNMRETELRNIDFLFKVKRTAGIKRLINKLFAQKDWEKAGQGWEGSEGELMLTGWSRKRRVIVLRRPIRDPIAINTSTNPQQPEFSFVEDLEPAKAYEYSVLVTSLKDSILTIAQHYRDRADAENNFDELKNQWGWGGFTTRDMARSQVMARMVALIYNWWTLFTRLAIPPKHGEAITTRPTLLHAVGKQISHAGQKRLVITSTHGKRAKIEKVLRVLSNFFAYLRKAAEQLSWEAKWRLILSRIFVKFLQGRPLKSPSLPAPT